MNMKRFITLLVMLVAIFNLHATEGMWLPILLKKYNMEQMQQKGFKLTAEDIYDINNASLKDAVGGLVRLSNPFHHFCSGQIISDQALVLTNHHCAFGAIQTHSSLENDYLTNGFWAMNKDEELANEGIGISFLKRMEDVTDKVLATIPENADAAVRDSIIAANILALEKEAVAETHYMAKIKPFYSGNAYYLSVCEVFRDIRLVGAPPSAIGKFGGDTDNWMWPRHTGDFALLRIYVNNENKPADYSSENVPYKPIKHLEISLEGIKEGDFTMVLGYPGTTTEYLPSDAVKLKTEQINVASIKIRTKGLEIMKAEMNANPEVRIKYASKAAGLANSWKKWIGENRGLKRLDAINKKIQLENDFSVWVNENEKRKEEYGQILPKFKELYAELSPYEIARNYYIESIYGLEILRFSSEFIKLYELNKTDDTLKINSTIRSLKIKANNFYKNYDINTDKKLFAAFIEIYYIDMPKDYHPEILNLISSKFNNNIQAFADYIYNKSILPYPEKTYEFIENFKVTKLKKVKNDPVYQLLTQASVIYRSRIYPPIQSMNAELSEINRLYMKGLIEFKANETLFPDANSTFRVSYGQIDNYSPKDGVTYFHQTTLQGIIEKDNPDIYDYAVPDKLKELYHTSNFGDYGNSDGSMPVCFTASNHTTGGNSGSPILNATGQLIGINFDRNWEGTMSDIMYDPEMCRNISLDIRYMLFIVDKFAGAGHLVEEMNIKKPIEKILPLENNAIID
jgi:hypothetical protein